MPAPDTCPACGALVPARAKACPDCGSDDSTGWSDDARAQSLGLPDENFSYDEFVQREFGKPRRSRRQLFWWIVAVAVLALMLLLLLPRI